MKTKSGNFKQAVLGVVKNIPRGCVLTYKDVALRGGRPRAYRAVGNILNKNHNPKIPCHRVVLASGRPGGYNRGVKNKLRILRREGIKI